MIDPRGHSIGTAHFSSTSQITLRLLTPVVEIIDRPFFVRRISEAQTYRQRVVQDSNAYRVVYSEADGLPGLIVDRYGDWLSVQLLTQGMDAARQDILAALQELLQPAGIVLRNDAQVRRHESLPLSVTVAHGQWEAAVPVSMNGLEWSVDLLCGHKTGIYLDQRENYRAAAHFAHGRALDCFTSTGGFALHLARRCENVLAIDSSAAALATATSNASTNGIGNVMFQQADVFELLTGLEAQKRRFDTIVLDPPAFTKSRGNIEGAARGYKDINLRALRLLEPGGLLVTCSCSHHFSEAAMLEVVAEASLDAHRTLRVLERRTQAADHPILLTAPETLYLKCLLFHVQ